jgi:hypothetical protein
VTQCENGIFSCEQKASTGRRRLIASGTTFKIDLSQNTFTQVDKRFNFNPSEGKVYLRGGGSNSVILVNKLDALVETMNTACNATGAQKTTHIRVAKKMFTKKKINVPKGCYIQC